MKVLLAAAALMFAGTLQAEPTNIQKLSFKTQHGTPVKLHAGLRTIIFAHDMSSKDIVDEAISDKAKGYLEQHNAAFVANISDMPRIIARMFAYPAMRKENYDIWLDEMGTQTTDWDQAEDKVTVYSLNNLTISTVELVDSPQQLMDIIETSQTDKQTEEPEVADKQQTSDENPDTGTSSDTNQQ